MIIILLFAIAAIGAAVLLSGSNNSDVMNTYCNLECQDRKIRDYSICC